MKSTSPALRRLRRVGIGVVAVLVLVIVGFLAWASTPMMGTRAEALTVWRDSALTVEDVGDAVVLAPAGAASGSGLVFYPGALVDPYAYLYKLSGVVADTGATVVIVKPPLNLAFFDQRPLSDFTSAAPDVHRWFVGGHSLGGVRACQTATDPAVTGLILFGSYCANDLSRTALTVLSISGTRDGLSTPDKINKNRHLLPPGTEFVRIRGMNHAQFGNYGPQPGDQSATITDKQAKRELTAALSSVL